MQKQLLWIALGGIACASSRPVADTRATGSPSIVMKGVGERVNVNGSSKNLTNLGFTVDEVWKVLPAVFDSLGVTVTVRDPAAHIIGSERAKVRRRLGREPLSRYLECGGTQVGANADSTLATQCEAEAKPIALSQGYSRCSSKGLFELQLADAVKKRLQG